jgi:repressor LexA
MTATEPLTTRQHEVLAFIRLHLSQHGFPPTYRQIGQALNIRSVNGVRQHVLVLAALGYVTRVTRSPRGSVYPVEVTP